VKKFLTHLSFLFTAFLPCMAFAQFTGGTGGGIANELIASVNCSPVGLNPFAGGIDDGHSNVVVINTNCSPVGLNPFAGGIDDGHSNVVVINTNCSPIGLNPFAGGIDDGHSNVVVINTNCSPVGLNPFAGGIDDGHSNVVVINTNCSPIGLNPFAGGISEGHSNFSLLVIDPIDCTTPLPITLLFFDALAKERKVYLKWATASEINNDFFTIERSKNGLEWEKVVNVKGAGFSSTLLNYDAIDHEPYSGISYYRLKQTDFDGQYAYSNIRAVNIDSDKDIVKIYPNPTNDRFYIVTSGDTDYNVSILDAYGKTIFSDNNSKEISTQGLASGMYVVRIIFTDGETTIVKLIVNK
jgi:hypothetical protein